jgi:hypothetical protein
MRIRKVWLVVLTVILVALLGAGLWAGAVQAQPPLQQPATGTTIPYPGHLTGNDSQPVADGTYAFTFALYSTDKGGDPLWSEAQEGVAVQGGAFLVSLGSAAPIPAAVLKSSDLWLEVAVRGPAESSFTMLSPRQQLNAVSPQASTPQQGAACPHNHLGEVWDGGGGVGLMITGTYALGGLYGSARPIAPGMVSYGVYGRGIYSFFPVPPAIAIGVGGDTNDPSGYGGGFGNSGGGFALVANGGGDGSISDRVGDILLQGDRGEIFSFGTSMDLYSDNNVDIHLDANNDDTNSGLYIMNGNGAIVATFLEDGTKSAVLRTESYGQRAVYAMESPEVWLEDFGTASLVDGVATVTLEPIFAQTVNLEKGYHVFVTPITDESVVLSITAKTTTGFRVKGVTMDGKPANCSFDYRIVAKRLGLEDVRLRTVPDLAGGK